MEGRQDIPSTGRTRIALANHPRGVSSITWPQSEPGVGCSVSPTAQAPLNKLSRIRYTVRFAITSPPHSGTRGSGHDSPSATPQAPPISLLLIPARSAQGGSAVPLDVAAQLLTASPGTQEVAGSDQGMARPTVTFQRRQF